MAKVIFSRPDWNDQATRWGTYWTKVLLDKCPFDKIELYKEQARRAPNEAAIKANPTAMYYGFGHGNADVFTGQNTERIIDAANVALWDKSFVHLLSCSVFAKLGLKFPHGSGYAKTYYFYVMQWPNDVAKMYYDSDHTYMLTLWKDMTKAESQKALKDRYTYWYKNGPPYGKDYLPWDRDCHTITGDPNAKPEIEPPEPPEPKYSCPWSDFKTDDLEALKSHIFLVHCPACPPQPERPQWCKWFGDLVSCPIPS